MDTMTKPKQEIGTGEAADAACDVNRTDTEGESAHLEEEACPAETAAEDISGEMTAVLKRKLPKISDFFAKYWGLFAAPLIAFVIYMIQLAVSGVYPFGAENVVASYDLSAQICPFIEHLFDVFDGKSSLFYSYAVAGGADVFGTFAYFFISPFSFIFLLFGDGNVYNACGIVMALKLAAIAFAGAWFVKKLFRKIPDYVGVAIGVVYAYCGYTFVANTYINWVDFLIYMPFCAAAFVHFTKTNKFLPFSILTACCIYTCFSIACFSLFTVFPALIAYAFFCVKKENRNSFIAYLCLAFLVAILLAMPLLAAALMAYLRGGRGGGIFDELWYGFVRKESGYSFDVKGYFDRSGEALYRKASYILSDSVFVVLTLVYFVRSKLKTPLSRFMLVAGVFTLLPVIVDESMLLLNMGSYMSYALRFGFLNALYFLGGACLAIDGLDFSREKAFDGTALNEKKRKGGTIVYAVVCLAAAVGIACFVSSDAYLTIWKNFISDSVALDNAKAFSGMFSHSLGGLQVIAVLFLVVAFVTVLGVLMVKNKRLSARVMAALLIAVAGVQVLFYNEQLVVGNNSTHYNINHYKTLTEELNEREDGYFRVKDYSDKMTANIPFTGDSNSFSVFSSVVDADNFGIVPLFGYYGNGRNSMKSKGGNVFGDAFLGYKYFFVPTEEKEYVQSRPYMVPVETKDENGEAIRDEDGSVATLHSGAFYMFENTLVFPAGYTVPGGELHFPQGNTSEHREENQLILYEFLSGREAPASISTKAVETLGKDLQSRAADIKVGAGEISAAVTAKEGDYLFLNFVASKGYKVTVNEKPAKLVDNDLHFLLVKLEAGENTVKFVYSSPYVKYFAVGLAVSVVALLAVALVVKKTRFMKSASTVIAWLGVSLAIAVVLFFMVYPTLVYEGKLLTAVWTKLTELAHRGVG